MQHLDWNRFKIGNANPQTAFEDLCYFLFCRQHKLTNGVFGYKNQTGIEKEPVLLNGKWTGFQSKFFDHTVNWSEIQSSIDKAAKKNPKLNAVYVYTHIAIAESSNKKKKKSQPQLNTEKFAKKRRITITWVGPSQFLILLNKPANLDLAQLYFGEADEFAFLQNNISSGVLTFLESPCYLELSILDTTNKKLSAVAAEILKSGEKTFLITGHPGSGKSVLAHKLFSVYSGLDKAKIQQSLKVLEKNGAIPMRVDLKLCGNDSIENIIRGRQNDYELRHSALKFIYLFDGLDELNTHDAGQVLNYIADQLFPADRTHKIIFLCRSGNLNIVTAKAHLPKIQEFRIARLDVTDVQKYFKQRIDQENLFDNVKLTHPDRAILTHPKLIVE